MKQTLTGKKDDERIRGAATGPADLHVMSANGARQPQGSADGRLRKGEA